MDKFVARYDVNGVTKSVWFNKSSFDEEKARGWLNAHDIKNFFFFFEPYEPTPFGEDGMLFKGEVGFDITTEILLPHIGAGKKIILDSFGGSLFEGWKIHDSIKALGVTPEIGVIGSCASAAVQIFLASENRWLTENSRLLIHNPWAMEAGDDEAMRKMANDLEAEKIRLAKFYSTITGKSAADMLALMKEERFMDADECLQLGFTKQIKNKLITNENEENMTNQEVGEKLNGLERVLNSFAEKFNKFFSPKNIMLIDVNGVELDFPEAETMEQIAVGMTVTAGGEPANGDYTMEDGTIYRCENGSLIEIVAPAGDDSEQVEQLQEQVATLTNQLSEAQTQLQAAITERDGLQNSLAEMGASFEGIKNEFATFKTQFSKGNPSPVNTPPATKTGGFSYKKKK